jgi:hypothetical protein
LLILEERVIILIFAISNFVVNYVF